MNNASAAEVLFFGALEKETAAERAAYLVSACEGDAELRRQVQKMLKAHPKVGDFLNRPVGEQLVAALEASDATQAYNVPTDGTESALEGTDGEGSDNEEGVENLHFLSPSARPDSLGRIGHYEVLQVLGKGGFGIVLRAFDEVLERVIALKVLAPALAVTAAARKRFLREARSSAQVRHENVVGVHAVEEQPLPYLVMEFIPGETLQERLDRSGPLEVPEIVRIGRQIAEGLAAAHATGLIHRDIKPSNILLEAGAQGRVKITDFGLARAADDASLSHRGVLAGTPMFMAPEQVEGETLDHRADLFSLGSVLYVMATGRPPFRAATAVGVLKRVVHDEPRPIRDVVPEIPQWLCEIIARLHSKKPEDRFATAREVAELLGRCLAEMQRPENVSFLIGFGEAMRAARRRAEASQKDVLEKKALLEREVQSWRHSDKRFARFMQHLPNLAWIKDLQGRYVYANDAAAKAFRTSQDRLYGKTDDDIFPPQTAAQFEENDRRALASDTGVQIIETLEHEGGIVHHSIVSKFPILGADGKPALIGGMAFDVTGQLHVMAAGRPPLYASDTVGVLEQVVEKGPQPIRDVVPEIPHWLGEIIARLHSKEPEDRFATDREVAELLGRYLTEVQRFENVPILPDITLAEIGQVPPSCEIPEAAATKRRRRLGTRRWAVVAAVLLMLLGGLGFTEATGVTDFHGTVIRLFSSEGTLVVELDDPAVSVEVVGSEVVITGAGAKEIRLKSGSYTVVASKDGKLVRQELVTVTKNGKQVVRISQEAKAAETATDAATWERSASTLPAVERAKAVALRLQELNPGFDGAITPTIERGVVTGLEINIDRVIDLSPVRVLTGLTSLACLGSDAFTGQLIDGAPSTGHEQGRINIRSVGKSRFADLSPLKGLPLTALHCVNCDVSDLAPLKGMKLKLLHVGSTLVHDLSPLVGMPLEDLDFSFTKVTDIAPLKGMKLASVGFEATEVSDLTPLKGMALTHLAVGRKVTDLTALTGMPLEELTCHDSRVSDLSPLKGMALKLFYCSGTLVTDISPLKGMPLSHLGLDGTKVSDLAPLRGMRLYNLAVHYTNVSDLSPLKGMPLEKLQCQGSKVTDLSPVKDLPLTWLYCDFRPERDAKVLRAIPTLKTINGKPAAEFWRSVEKK